MDKPIGFVVLALVGAAFMMLGCATGGAKPPIDPQQLACLACGALSDPAASTSCRAQFCAPAPTEIATAETTPRATPTTPPTTAPTATAPAVATPTAAPTVATPAPGSVPVVFKVNGGQVPDPGTGAVGFTLFLRCPDCVHNQAWPCDSDHAGWPGGKPYGPWDGRGSDVALMYKVCSGRSWDATCASVGSFTQSVYPGDAHFEADSGRNCYSGRIVGNGQYLVCLPAHAKACADPRDYEQPETWESGCAHGEVELTDHQVCQGPFQVAH